MMPPAAEATEARAQPIPLEVTKYHLKHVYQKKIQHKGGGGGLPPPPPPPPGPPLNPPALNPNPSPWKLLNPASRHIKSKWSVPNRALHYY